jgi:hypothetical protein
MFPTAIYCNGANAPINDIDIVQRHPLGQRMILEDGRVFVYAKASGTQIPDVGSQVGSHQHIANCAIGAVAAKGALSIVLHASATDGAAHNGLIAKNELVGGYVVVFPAATNHAFVRRIVSNSACTISQANDCTIEVDAPIPVALTTSDTGEAMASPYLNVKTASSTYASVVGVPAVAATDGTWFWLQTWGVCWIATSAECGAGENDRNVVFRYNGSGDECAYNGTYNTAKAQQAGFILANAYGGTQGAPFIMLQISP